MKRILFISTGLGVGGAEKQLVRLLSRLREKTISIAVVSLSSRGVVSNEIEGLDIPVLHLNLERLLRFPFAFARLMFFILAFKPDVIHGWMYHGNFVAWWVKRLFAPRARLLWGVRQSFYGLDKEKPLTGKIIRFCAKVSGKTDAIVYNAHVARAQHESFGFAAAKSTVIDNGFDPDNFHPDPEAYAAIRRKLGLAPDTLLIGLIARFHPMKGHAVFIEASKRQLRCENVHFLLAGRGVTPDAPAFSAWYAEPGLTERLHLLGERQDIPGITAALDIAVSSSSWGEGFSNTVCEAMSCAVPVVATDVGDSRRILGEAGLIVPPGDASALAAAWERLLAMPAAARQQMGRQGRSRVMAEFSLSAVADRYFHILTGGDDGH
jgi:glycosyltransferase involved in cell wall biosynthesis